MSALQPTREIACLSPTRSGTIKLLHALVELGICAYWSSFTWMWEEYKGGLRSTE